MSFNTGNHQKSQIAVSEHERISLKTAVTCNVCFDIYTNPQALGCLHTYCKPCVQKLLRNNQNRVTCPECRRISPAELIQHDFKAEDLVDKYRLGNINSAEVQSPHIDIFEKCDVCHESDVILSCRCEECKQSMCSKCELIHKGLTHTKFHKTESVLNINFRIEIKDNEEPFNWGNTNRILEKESLQLGKLMEEVNLKIKQLNTNKEQQLKSINALKNEMIQDIEAHCKQQLHILNRENDHVLKPLLDIAGSCEKQLSIVEGYMDYVDRVVEGAILEMASGDNAARTHDLIRTRLEEMQMKRLTWSDTSKLSSPTRVMAGKRWDCKSGPQVQMTSLTPSKMVDRNRFNFSHITNEEFTLEKETYLENKALRMVIVKDTIWCVNNHEVIIYAALDLKKMKEIYLEKDTSGLTYCREFDCVVFSHGNDGLWQYDATTSYRSNCICEGKYADVFWNHSSSLLYALKLHSEPVVIMFAKGHNNQFVRKQLIYLYYQRPCLDDKFWISKDDSLVTVSSYNNDKIYGFNVEDGKRVWALGESGLNPGQFKGCILSYVCDVSKSLIVTDLGNHRIQVCFHEESQESWKVVKFYQNVELKDPIQTVLQDDGPVMWVLCKRKVNKFVIKEHLKPTGPSFL